MSLSQERDMFCYSISMIKALLFILALTFPIAVSSNAFSLNTQQKLGKRLSFIVIISIIQAVMWILGKLLGSSFMHLLSDYAKFVPIVLCFIIMFRMLIDTIKIKNGGNIFIIDNIKQLLFLSVALGINTFFVGLGYDYFPLLGKVTPLVIACTTLVWAVIGTFIPFSKIKLLINSLLNLFFAFIIIFLVFLTLL